MRILSNKQIAVESRNQRIKELWQELSFQGARKTTIAEHIGKEVGASYSTVLRAIKQLKLK